MTTEIFQEVVEEDMPKVLKALRKDWPKHFLLHQILTVFEEYKKAGTKWKHTLFKNGDFETGVYLNSILMEFPDIKMNFMYIYTMDCDLTVVKRSLQQTQIIPWHTSEFCFPMIHNRFSSAIEEAFASKSVNCEISHNTMFWFPPEKQLQIKSLPDDVYIEFLDESYAAEMDRTWPHRSPGSELTHREHLQKNFGLGLFRKTDKKMVCSALSNYSGGIFVLYSDPAFRGKGYASLVVQQMVQEIRQRDRIPFCTVIIGNKPSENMFRKNGFEPFTNADYIFPT